MRRNEIVSVICICGLLLSGCGSDGASDKKQETAKPTQEVQLGGTDKMGADKDGTGKAETGKTESGGTASGTEEITEEKAKEIALEKVPGAKQIHIERDMEDGRQVYEGEIFYENTEYEFEIDAATGEIVSWEEDKH